MLSLHIAHTLDRMFNHVRRKCSNPWWLVPRRKTQIPNTLKQFIFTFFQCRHCNKASADLRVLISLSYYRTDQSDSPSICKIRRDWGYPQSTWAGNGRSWIWFATQRRRDSWGVPKTVCWHVPPIGTHSILLTRAYSATQEHHNSPHWGNNLIKWKVRHTRSTNFH